MTFRLNRFSLMTAERPRWSGAGTEVSTAGTRHAEKEVCPFLFQHVSGHNARGMFMTYHRERPEGRVHRARLRAVVVPTLRVGAAVPGSSVLAHLLGIHPSEAGRHMRRVLDEDGIGTETHGRGRGRRIYVVSLQDWRAAA